MGYSEKLVAANGVSTVADVFDLVNENNHLAGTLLFAVNMDYAKLDTPVNDGDEVAFFPPVTGGTA